MMYVVKVGNYYIKGVEYAKYQHSSNIILGNITLSKEIMRNFDKKIAEAIAKETNGEVIEIVDEVSHVEESDYKQLSLFDMEA